MSKQEKKQLVPKMRFPDFQNSGDWKERPVSDLITEVYRPMDMVDTENYSLVTVKRRYGGIVRRGIFKGASIKVKSQFYIQENDFLISKRQIVHNACGVVPKEFAGSIVSNEYSVLRATQDCDITFFNYFVQQPIVSQSFLNYSIGIHIEKMLFKLNDWLGQEFIFPTIKEQKKIANCLASIDELIIAETDKLDALKKHKMGLMQKLFPSEGKAIPEWRFPEFRDNVDWVEKELKNVGEIVTGKTPNTSDESLWNGSIQFVTPTDITEEKYQTKTQRTVKNISKIKVLPKHSIMFTCIASIGKMALSVSPCITNQQINSIIPNKYYNNDFIYYALLKKSFVIKAQLANTTLPIINKTEFSKFSIAIPETKEQQKISDCLSSLDDLIFAQTKKIDAIKTHKKGLLQGLFPVDVEVVV